MLVRRELRLILPSLGITAQRGQVAVVQCRGELAGLTRPCRSVMPW